MDFTETENSDRKLENPLEIDGELLELAPNEEIAETLLEEETVIVPKRSDAISLPRKTNSDEVSPNSKFYQQYFFLPFIFLTVALLGGLRIGVTDSEFIFLRPALICLIFATLLLTLFFRAGLIEFEGWFSERFSTLKNVANGAVLLSLFAATTQVFNSLIPEQGLPFWVISFCFLWTLWNNLFAEFNTKRLLQSLGGLFGFAFVAKYLVLANLVSSEGSWLTRIWQDPGKEVITYFLDLPRFASATGYIQFFALGFFLIGLFFMRPRMD